MNKQKKLKRLVILNKKEYCKGLYVYWTILFRLRRGRWEWEILGWDGTAR
jgi:hypothetical protein